MRKQILLSCFIIIALFCASCESRVMHGEGAIGTINPKVPSFNSVQVEIPLKVIINVRKGSQPSIKFTGYANFLLHMVTKVEKDMLFISSDLESRMAMEKSITAEITVPSL